MLYDLRWDMDAVVKDTPPERGDDDDDDPLPPTPAVILIAVCASIILIDKYIDLMKESKLYLFVMGNVATFLRLACSWPLNLVMCPDQKLDWFKNNGFTKDEIRYLKADVIAHWVQKYSPDITATEVINKQHKVKVHSFYTFIYNSV